MGCDLEAKSTPFPRDADGIIEVIINVTTFETVEIIDQLLLG